MNARHIDIIRQAHQSGCLKGPQLVLMLLGNRRREGWRLGDLSDVTGLSPTLIHSIKEGLVKKGMASVHYPARDKRVARIYLTDLGREQATLTWQALTDLAGIAVVLRTSSPPDSSIRSGGPRPTPG
jgi:DNA-binding MarR family transcriptional regulator